MDEKGVPRVWRVLLVHRDPEFQPAQRRFWEGQGHEVSLAHDVTEGIAKLRSDQPRVVVLCDGALRDEGDYEDARTLGSEARKMGVPLVLVRESEKASVARMNEIASDGSTAHRQKGR